MDNKTRNQERNRAEYHNSSMVTYFSSESNDLREMVSTDEDKANKADHSTKGFEE